MREAAVEPPVRVIAAALGALGVDRLVTGEARTVAVLLEGGEPRPLTPHLAVVVAEGGRGSLRASAARRRYTPGSPSASAVAIWSRSSCASSSCRRSLRSTGLGLSLLVISSSGRSSLWGCERSCALPVRHLVAAAGRRPGHRQGRHSSRRASWGPHGYGKGRGARAHAAPSRPRFLTVASLVLSNVRSARYASTSDRRYRHLLPSRMNLARRPAALLAPGLGLGSRQFSEILRSEVGSVVWSAGHV